MSFVKDLNTPLLQLSGKDNFDFTAACAGVHIFGGIGSGKTSGSGRMFAGAYLRAGMGCVVTAVKPEEIDLWQRYAMEQGCTASLVLFDESEGFNFLAYELGRQGMDGIGTVTECLMRVVEAAKRASPTAGQRAFLGGCRAADFALFHPAGVFGKRDALHWRPYPLHQHRPHASQRGRRCRMAKAFLSL
jgi:hypothetical protein